MSKFLFEASCDFNDNIPHSHFFSFSLDLLSCLWSCYSCTIFSSPRLIRFLHPLLFLYEFSTTVFHTACSHDVIFYSDTSRTRDRRRRQCRKRETGNVDNVMHKGWRRTERRTRRTKIVVNVASKDGRTSKT